MKKSFILLILLLFLIPTEGTTADKWTTEDKVLQFIWFGFHFIDWGQTSYITKNTPLYWEGVNPLLGKYPSTAAVNVWFIGTFVLHTALVHILRQEDRKILQGMSIAVSAGMVIHNRFSLGIQMDF